MDCKRMFLENFNHKLGSRILFVFKKLWFSGWKTIEVFFENRSELSSNYQNQAGLKAPKQYESKGSDKQLG